MLYPTEERVDGEHAVARRLGWGGGHKPVITVPVCSVSVLCCITWFLGELLGRRVFRLVRRKPGRHCRGAVVLPAECFSQHALLATWMDLHVWAAVSVLTSRSPRIDCEKSSREYAECRG